MRTGNFDRQRYYDLDSAGFQTAFEFLRRGDLEELPDGWIELGNSVRAGIQRYRTVPEEMMDFETHDRFFDVQYLARGRERIRVANRRGLVPKTPYDESEDVAFYQEPAASGSILLEAGDYVVLAPEDAHKPRCCVGEPMPVFKVVVKVPVL